MPFRSRFITLALVLGAVPAAAQAPPAANSTPPAPIALPTVDVVGTSPLIGTGIDRDKLPANVQTLPAPDITRDGPAPLVSGLNDNLGSININDNEDNPYHPDIQYRGFEASPVVGTPIGLAVYQNGVRLNEPFGDSISWDLVPDFAINRINIFPSNPVYGLNALGGALVLEMKNGFNFQGLEGSLWGGSFGQKQFTLEYGKQIGNVGAYLGLNAANDDGFRKLSQSQVRQLYVDVGAEGNHGSLHFSLTGAKNILNGIGPTPIQQVAYDRSAVFVSPQSFRNTVLMPALTANYIATDDLSIQSNFYYRSSQRKAFAGNITDARVCDEDELPDTICLDDDDNPLLGLNGQPVANTFGGAPLGENDANTITATGLGGSLQATYTGQVFGRDNHLVVGASIDHGDVDFTSTNELATVTYPSLVTSGTGIIINQVGTGLVPVHLETTNSYYGLYASNTFNLTPELALTGGARYNVALLNLMDKLGTALNGEARYSRLNPAAGFAYKVLPNTTAYFGYAEANRAPTAGEIACSDPTKPCTLDVFVSADPPGLKQVVSRSYEAGLRGKLATDLIAPGGKLEWNVGLFRTDVADDILVVPSAIISTGFFQNAGNTRRQGIEAGLTYRDSRWRVSASYSLVDATFESPIMLSSPNNPFADANGNIQVRPGNRMPGVPLHRLKFNADYWLTEKWSVGTNINVVSDQVYFGDQSNQNPPLAGYVVVNLRSSYHINDHVEIFGLVKNLFDAKYATYGIYNDPTTVPLPGVANPTDPRFVSVAAPLSFYGGVRVRF